MIKNITTFIAVVSLLATVSCKKKEENSAIVLDENNMIVAQDQSDQKEFVSQKKVISGEHPKIEIENSDFDFGNITQGDIVSHSFKIKNTGKPKRCG